MKKKITCHSPRIQIRLHSTLPNNSFYYSLGACTPAREPNICLCLSLLRNLPSSLVCTQNDSNRTSVDPCVCSHGCQRCVEQLAIALIEDTHTTAITTQLCWCGIIWGVKQWGKTSSNKPWHALWCWASRKGKETANETWLTATVGVCSIFVCFFSVKTGEPLENPLIHVQNDEDKTLCWSAVSQK